MENCEKTDQVPERVKKAAREIVDVLIQNHLRQHEAYSLLDKVMHRVCAQNPEVRKEEMDLSFCDD